MEKFNKLSLLFGFLIISLSFVSAVPQLTIHSPENITYDSNKILVNVTSNEPVDFYMASPSNSRIPPSLLAENTTSFESFVYVKNGSYKFDIFANNSNGETSENITFSTTAHNPINITDCGILMASNTEYVLGQDILSTFYGCIQLREMRNSTFNLMGHVIDTNPRRYALTIWYSSDIMLFNGTIKTPASSGSDFWGTLMLYGTKLTLENLTIEGSIGIDIESMKSSVIRNVTINSSVGIFSMDAYDLYIVDSDINWNGVFSPIYGTAAFVDYSSTHSTVILEESNMTGFPDYNFYLEGSFIDFYLRSSHINISKAHYPDWVSDARFFTQHLVIVNISDQFNLTGACSVQVLDNGVLPRLEGIDAKLKTLANPTAKVYIPTGETGRGQEWITEKLIYAKSSSPVVIEEYDFSNYTLTTKGWGAENYSQIILDLTGLNSTIEVDFKINTSLGKTQELPECTTLQMLDLNNDENVNILDATIVLRYIAGLPVSSAGTKECAGISLNAF